MSRRTVQELALAVGVGALIALSPLTPPGALASVGVGGAVATGLFLWRRRRLAPAQETTASAPRTAVPPTLLLALLMLVGVFAPTFQWLYEHWTGSIWTNEHGIFIPPLVAFLAWRTLQADPRPEREESSAAGLAWVAAGLSLTTIDAAVQTRYLSVLGFLLVLPGLALIALGPRRTRALAVPLAVSLLMMPIPRSFASDLALRHLTAHGVEPIVRALGFPVFRDLTVLHMSSGTFIVSNACSGFATLYASLAVAVVLSALARSHRERAVLLVAAIPLALAANTLRVVILVLLTTWWGHWVIDSKLHEASGVATFAVVLGCLFAMSHRLGAAPSPAPQEARA